MIGARIKEERERLKLTLSEFAIIAGAGKRTLSDWEKGTTYPTALQLSALITIGVDVTYIVTGQRSQAAITPEEQVMLDAYRKLPEENKKRLMVLALTGVDISASNEKKKDKANTKVSIKGDNNTGNIATGNIKLRK